jgi:dihydrofolate synthase / folylpolyglutamate synthase
MKNQLTNYEEVCQYLFYRPNYERTGRGAWKLDKMRRLLAALDNPQLKYKTIHVGGTNGKGSTASMIASVLHAAGYKTGLHTSPHLLDFAERFRLNGAPASHEWIISTVQQISPIIEEIRPSFFEISVALAFLYFAEMEVDYAVIEVGLGGRLDATNVLNPEAVAITNIGFDHTDKLGNTLAQIAKEKAGIFRPNVPVFSTEIQPEALDVLQQEATDLNSPFHKIAAKSYDIPLKGQHQQINASLAAALCKHLGISENHILEGLQKLRQYAGLRGRLDLMQENPTVIIDVGHNAEGIQTAMDYLESQQQSGDLSVMMGVMKDKDYEKVAHLLRKYPIKQVFAVQSDSPRALSASVLAESMIAAGLSAVVTSVEAGIQQFLESAKPSDKLLICGSHYVAEAAFKVFLAENASN